MFHVDISTLPLIKKKRIRATYSKFVDSTDVPPLLDIQLESYKKFLYSTFDNEYGKYDNYDLKSAFNSVFPIYSYSGYSFLQYIGYELGEIEFDVYECKMKGLNYSKPLKIDIRIIVYDKDYFLEKKIIKISKEQQVYICDVPIMTERGTFIINGTERVVVSQLHRAPGVFFEHDRGKTHSSGKLLYSARIIPYRGSWLDIEFDAKDIMYVRIDRRKKIPATILLRALGMKTEHILSLFVKSTIFCYKNKQFFLQINFDQLRGTIAMFDIKIGDSILIKSGRCISIKHLQELKNNNIHELPVPNDYIIDKVLYKNIIDRDGNEIIKANTKITKERFKIILSKNIPLIYTIYTPDIDNRSYISDTLFIDEIDDPSEALFEIYKVIRPGEPASIDAAEKLFKNLFFNSSRYDLSSVGRMKLNLKIKRNDIIGSSVLFAEDIISVFKILISIKDGKSQIDDIDHLGNRRVKTVGEMVENQFRVGLIRMERAIKDKLVSVETDGVIFQDIINASPLVSCIKEFFCSSQLSQFMDQNNPLSEITHKRRISALGPGGLNRERASFEVRDVHNTHYGRICPIETPEGPNIGLINSLSLYVKINNYGFLETPYRKIVDCYVLNEVNYLSAIEEGNYVIAQANILLDEYGKIKENLILCRHNGEFVYFQSDKVNYMDVSSKQIVSIAAALIPFLEHDDANRALMGSNMQRQAVPLICSEKPLVGTGIERIVAVDSGVTVVSKRGGKVDFVDSSRVVIRVNDEEISFNESSVDIYNFVKYERSNQNTCINQKPVVFPGDIVCKNDVLADGPSTDLGELSLGQNVLVAFVPWNGYNFEDSIIISERLVENNRFTSIHIEELVCIARDTKLGMEDITSDIPNVLSYSLRHLDDSGVVYIGANVKFGDVLVGKVTPKGETQLTPEEKLLRAIFGEKASDVKDTSLKVSSGMSGTVIDVKIFVRDGVKKDFRYLSIKESEFEKVKKNLNDERRVKINDMYKKIGLLLLGEELLNNEIVTEVYLSFLSRDKWLDLKCKNQIIIDQLQIMSKQIKNIYSTYDEILKIKYKKIYESDDLAPGVLKIVKVFLAVKRFMQSGDKMSGRHGNKGVISKVVPVEDMLYLSDGTPIDMILNPLGVPSRMNIGQILETHLGFAAKSLGIKLCKIINNNGSKEDIINFLELVYNKSYIYSMEQATTFNFRNLSDKELNILINNLKDGIPMSTPVFDGISEEKIKELLRFADVPDSGQVFLYDGQTGRKFDRPVTIGYMYMLKLNHLVDDKIHARSTGSYSLITQQPLGGRAQFGGQRFGEMEVWALEAYGAAYTLQEMLTVKSDDIEGRIKIYKNIIDGKQDMEAGTPESFNVLIKEIRALGLNIELEKD